MERSCHSFDPVRFLCTQLGGPADDALTPCARGREPEQRQLVDQARHLGGLDARRHESRRAHLEIGHRLAAHRPPVEDGDVVIEGRDIGTVVVPNAEVKVYLQADAEVRAGRRLSERPEIGADALATDLRMRDESDAARMRPAPDAELIDTTTLTVEDVVDHIERLVRERAAA